MSSSEERVARLLETLKRDGTLIIPSSKVRLTFRLILAATLGLLGLVLILCGPAMSEGTDTALYPFTLGLIITSLAALGFTATLRQLTQEIQLVLTLQGFRIENSNGGIVDQADWNDIHSFGAIHNTRTGTTSAVCYYLTVLGREHRREFLDTNPSGREQFYVFKIRRAKKGGSAIIPSGFTVWNDDLLELLTEAHRRYQEQGRRHHPNPNRTYRRRLARKRRSESKGSRTDQHP